MAQHVDVLIVGAGLSGIGAACHLRRECPDRTYAILEARDAIGGTWDLFRYPGVRSDSDMFTLGYSFRPWTEPKAIADGAAILRLRPRHRPRVRRRRHIRFRHRVVRAEWSTAHGPLDRHRAPRGHRRDGDADLLVPVRAAGLLPLRRGLHARPSRASSDFAGPIVHPQHWPDDLDYAGKRVVVIGSGATAVTLVPAMAEQAAHVTMLQRSPTYVMALPSRDRVADRLRRRAARRAGVRAWCGGRTCSSPWPSTSSAGGARALVKSLLRRGAAGASCRPATTSTRTSRRRTTRGTSGCASSPTATCSAPISAGTADDRHRRDRAVHRARHPAGLGRGAAGRHRRHRDRAEPAGPRRHAP